MPALQKLRSLSSAVRHAMEGFAAPVRTANMKMDRVLAKAPDAFPWDEISDASTADGDASSGIGGGSLGRISEVSEDSVVCALPYGPDEPVVIFDYDDTLLPTSFFDRLGTLPSIGWQLEEAEKHAKQVESTLRAARSLGRVAIVTMANERWLAKSSRRYLPGLDIEDLAAELDIPLVFANDHSVRFAHLPSFEAAVACKSAAIESCFEGLGLIEAVVCKPLNVVSVGNSYVEHKALKSVLATWGAAGRFNAEPVLKTVRFLACPTLTQLTAELQHLEESLNSIVSCASGFHLVAASSDEFEEEVWEQVADISI